jgi:N-acetylmuramoyl-L-alanine amidase
MLLAALFAFGCVHPHLPVIADLSILTIDTQSLKDKVIIIDPGHGGPERGATGVRGITESEVNLTVALHLWGLLKQAGARPLLTRFSDQALHTSHEFDLAADLALRKQVGADDKADLFVSIHHNASLNRSQNSLIVFYAMDDPYGSRDAARAIAAALQHRLGRENHSVQAGNYTVLRSRQAAAILGEASFISHKKNELDLAYTRTLAAEARGYFDGILTFFSRGIPLVRDMRSAESGSADARPRIRACLDPGHEKGRIDISSVTAAVDGKPVRRIIAAQNCIEFVAPELSNGNHRACVAFRNMEGNSTQRCIDIAVALPPHRLAITSAFSVLPPDARAATVIDVYVRDRLGRPVLDGTPVAITTTSGTLLQTESFTTNGHARAMLAAGDQAGTALLNAASGNCQAGMQIRFAVPDTALLTLSVRDTAGQPVHGAALICGTTLAYSDRYGCLQAEIKQAGEKKFQLVRQGYEPYMFTLAPAIGSLTMKNAVLQPIDGGIFLNRTIMLDPEGSSTAAIPVLKKLQEKIESAGGRAPFTWQAEPAPPYRERVMQASAEAADVFLSVSAESRRCNAGHYHRSAPGLDLAQRFRGTFDEQDLTGWRKCAISHSSHDAVLHTSMPAVELALPRKLARTNPGAVAQAMYEAVRQWLQESSRQEH